MHDLPLKTPVFFEALGSSAHWLMLCLCLVLVGSVVGLHYEALERLNNWLPRLRLPARLRVLVLIYGLMAVHTLEIWIFGVALYGVTLFPDLGRVTGADGLVLQLAGDLSSALPQVGTSLTCVNAGGGPGTGCFQLGSRSSLCPTAKSF